MATLFIFGDSITLGAWDSQGGWATRLRKYAMQETIASRVDLTVYLLGIDGDTTRDVLQRFDSEVAVRSRYTETFYVMFDIGGNDTIWNEKKQSYNASPEEFEQQYTRLLEKAKALGGQVFSLGILPIDESQTTPMPWSTDESYFNARISEYDQIIRRITAAAQTNYLDVVECVDPKTMPDGVHPGDSGHQAIYEKVRDELIAAQVLPAPSEPN